MEKDDLLNMKENNKNIKKPILYGAVAFLVFIVAVIVYALYSNSKEEKNVVLPPQVEVKKVSEFKKVPIEDTQKELPIEENNADNETFSKPVEENGDNVKNANNGNVEGLVKENQENSENDNKNKKTEEKTPIKKSELKNTATVENKQPKIQNRYYIQVAALIRYKKPNRKFLNLIKKEGFDYTLYKTYIVKNGEKIPVTKILIGPFDNIETAKKNLRFVKERITKNAFIFKVKE